MHSVVHVFVAGIFKVAWMVLDVPFNTETGARADLAMGDTSSGHTLVPKKSNSLPTGWLAYWTVCLGSAGSLLVMSPTCSNS